MTDESNDAPPDLVKMINDLRAAGLPIPDDADPVQVLAALLAARADAGGDKWEGFDLMIGDDVPIVVIQQLMEDEILPKMRRMFETDGGLTPVGFVFARNAPTQPGQKAPDGHARHFIISPGNIDFTPESKGAFSRALKLLAWKTDAAAVLFASEAWIVESMSGEDVGEFTGRLNEHPDHREIIMVTFERDVGRGAFYRAQVFRDEEGNVTGLGEWERELRDDLRRSGRFTNFLLQNEVVVRPRPRP